MKQFLKAKIKMFSLFAGAVLLSLASCKKRETINQNQKETYKVTYTFTSEVPAYYISITDITNLNDFEDSIFTPTFSKTITYDYKATYGCYMSNRNNQVSDKSISITLNGKTITTADTLYSSLSSFIVP